MCPHHKETEIHRAKYQVQLSITGVQMSLLAVRGEGNISERIHVGLFKTVIMLLCFVHYILYLRIYVCVH